MSHHAPSISLHCLVKYKRHKTSNNLKNAVINDNSHGNITKHLGCNVLLYYKFITHVAGERIFKICEHLAKLRTKWLIASCAPVASCFFPQRCWTRQISRIICVWRTETVTNCYVNRQIHLTLLSTDIKFLKTSLDLYWLTDPCRQRLLTMYSILPQHLFLCCSNCVQWSCDF